LITQKSDMKNAKWKRNIIRIYWIFVLIYMLGEVISLAAGWESDPDYVMTYFYSSTALPILTMLLALLSLEILSRYTPMNLDYVFIVAATIIAGSLMITNHHIPVMQAVIFVPVCLSVLFFDKVKIVLSTFINLIVVVCFYAFTESDVVAGFGPQPFSLIVISFILITCCATGLLVVNRGAEVLSELRLKILSEISLQEEKAWIEEMSKTDALTGLANHKSFHEILDKITNSKEMSSTIHLALADIDNFKAVNDIYGHWVGDIVLKEAAAKLKNILQPYAVISRYGGEEFGILFQGVSDAEVIEKLENARQAIALNRIAEMDSQHVTISMGVHKMRGTDSKETLFKRADAALYEAKRSGKNKLSICGSDEV
jgi:diguanylate cyclase